MVVCIGGVLFAAVSVIALANFLSDRSNQRRAQKMMRDKANGAYDARKKYLGDQGHWQTDAYTDTSNAPPK